MSQASFMHHQLRCVFLSWTPARPPAPSAVSQAATILLQSAMEENLSHSPQFHAGECTFCQYEQRVKAVQAAVQALSYHFDHLIAQSNQERNRYCAVYQLPVEILSFILVLACDKPEKPTMSDIARFRGVSKYFRGAIDATAAFWTDIRLGHPLAQEALVKSRGLLIDISTPRNAGMRLSAFLGGRDPLVEGVEANSSRWRSLSFVGHPTPVELGLLRCTAPHLRDLYLDFQSILYGTPHHGQPLIDPGEGIALRHLCLSSVRLPWLSTRLKQLKTLQLYSIEAPPSRAELYLMLACSIQLEQLVLSALGWNAALERGFDLGSAEPLTFPHLAEITLFDLPSELTDLLCSVIRAPNANSLMVGSAAIEMFSLQDEEWTPFHDTVEGCLDDITCIDIEVDCDRGAIDIRTQPRFGELSHPSPKWRKLEDAHSFDMDCPTDDALLDFPILAEFLAEKGDGMEFRLNLIPTDRDPSEDEVEALLRGLTALKGLTDLNIGSFQAGGQVVKHLSVEHEDEIGVPAWVCPWLTKLNVEDVPDIDQNDWEALLEARGPRRRSRPGGTEPPLRITELQENVEEMRQTWMMD